MKRLVIMLNAENILNERRDESSELAARMSLHPASESPSEVCASGTLPHNSAEWRPSGLSGFASAGIIPALGLKRILVPFDFSTTSVRLLRWLASQVDITGARLTAVHVVTTAARWDRGENTWPTDSNEAHVETRRLLLKGLLDSIDRGTDSISAHVAAGEPTEQILQFARETQPDLIAMAIHGPRVLKPLFISATTERITRQARCPVLVVPEAVLTRREDSRKRNGSDAKPRIVVPIDFSANSSAALRFANDLAKAGGTELHVLNFCGDDSSIAEASRAQLDSWVRAHLPRPDRVTVTLCEHEPSVYMLINRIERIKADLIVLGARGYAWTERFRLNSTMDGILRNAPCPVISMRAGAYPAGQ
jgi:nucleotide-binding universal stress UspA family protein